MIKFSVKSNLNFQEFNFDKELNHVAEKIIVSEIAGNIAAGTDLKGSPYPPLAASTIKAKGDNRPLIGKERRLYSASAFANKKQGKNEVVIYIKPIRADIARYLQVEGVKSKVYGRRRFNFFGVSDAMESKAVKYMSKRIKELTSGK